MSVDQRVRELLSDAADDVRPLPDVAGRIRARYRRGRRRRMTAAGLGLAAVIGIGGWTGLPTDSNRVEPGASDFDSMQQWAERLRHTPTRGELAKSDPEYVHELARLIAEHQRAGAFRVKSEVTVVNVLYLDDIGDARVAFVAFHLAAPDPTTEWINASAWFLAPRGASAAELADPRSTAGTSDGLEPFEVIGSVGNTAGQESPTAIALAPDGCIVETAPLPALDNWTPASTGSYLVRTRETERPEWWRVVCDGTVRQEEPARRILPTVAPTAEDIDAAVAGARGRVDRQDARDALAGGADPLFGAGRVTVIWGGRIKGAKPDDNGGYDGRATLVAYPAVRGGWHATLDTRFDQPTTDGAIGRGAFAWLPWDPSKPSTLVPIRLGESESVLVVTPPGTNEVRAVRGSTTIDTATVTDAAAVVNAPDTPDLVFEALDTNGAVITKTETLTDPPTNPQVVGW